MGDGYRALPITNYLLPITYYLLPITLFHKVSLISPLLTIFVRDGLLPGNLHPFD